MLDDTGKQALSKTAFYTKCDLYGSLVEPLTKTSIYQTHLLDRLLYFAQLLIEVDLLGQSIFCYNRPYPRILCI